MKAQKRKIFTPHLPATHPPPLPSPLFLLLFHLQGRVYEGQLSGMKPEGKGTIVAPWGVRYVGTWADGLYHGKGKLTYADGSKYEGHFKGRRRACVRACWVAMFGCQATGDYLRLLWV